jgi:CRP-like cAMP-binding protein
MTAPSRRQLITVLRGCIRGGNHLRALRLLITNLERGDGDYALRPFVADVLRAMGRTGEAGEILEILVRHFTNSGQPLRAILIAHRLAEFEPDVGSHFDHIAAVYGVGSPFLDYGERGSPAENADTKYDLQGVTPDLALDVLAELAYDAATQKDGFANSPDAVPPIPLLSSFGVRTLRKLLEALTPVEFGDGEILLGPDSKPPPPTWIASGQLKASQDNRVCTLGAGCMFGHELLTGQKTLGEPPSLRTRGPVEALVLPHTTALTLRKEKEFAASLTSFGTAFILERALSPESFFGDVPLDERAALLDMMTACALDDRTTIVEQGEASKGVYIILDGQVDISRKEGEWEVTVTTLSAGDLLGELTSETEALAPATAVTDGPVRLLYMSKKNISGVTRLYPSVLERMKSFAARQLVGEDG